MAGQGNALSPAIRQALMQIRARIEAANEKIEHHDAELTKARNAMAQIPHEMDVAIKSGDSKQVALVATKMNGLEKQIATQLAALTAANTELAKEQANFAHFAGH